MFSSPACRLRFDNHRSKAHTGDGWIILSTRSSLDLSFVICFLILGNSSTEEVAVTLTNQNRRVRRSRSDGDPTAMLPVVPRLPTTLASAADRKTYG